jgi:hypothetical protein
MNGNVHNKPPLGGMFWQALTWCRGNYGYLIPILVFAWGVSLALLSALVGNFWIERDSPASLVASIFRNGEIVKGSSRILEVAVTTGSPPPATIQVGYLFHLQWMWGNMFLFPVMYFLIIRIYRDQDNVVTSLVQSRVLTESTASWTDTAQTLKRYFQITEQSVEPLFFAVSIAIAGLYAWNTGNDYQTNLGFSQPHFYPQAYHLPLVQGGANQVVPDKGLMNLFVLLAFGGTIVSLIPLSHYGVWAIRFMFALSKLFPKAQRDAVDISVDGIVHTLDVRLNPDDPHKRFGLWGLTMAFDTIHWIGAILLLEVIFARLGELIREREALNLTVQDVEMAIFSGFLVMVLFLLPVLLTCGRVRAYRLALLAQYQADPDMTAKIKANRVWPSGSASPLVMFGMFLSLASLLLTELFVHPHISKLVFFGGAVLAITIGIAIAIVVNVRESK